MRTPTLARAIALAAFLSTAAWPSAGALSTAPAADVDPLSLLSDAQQRNLDAALHLAALANDGADPITLAQAATRAQADLAGLAWTPAPAASRHALPSEAARELALRQNVAFTPEQESQLAQLDTLDEPLRASLTGLFDAFLAFDAAARAAYEGEPAAPDVAPILAARVDLLEAVRDFQAKVAGQADLPVPASTNLCPVLAVDLNGASSTYGTDCQLIVDVGGWDTYNNNAGGSRNFLAAALVDLDGWDTYNDPYGWGGSVGGGYFGAGFLYDAAGDDIYDGGWYGSNGGGANLGVGFLLDALGWDRYYGDGRGSNGGGADLGYGLLLDATGGDYYSGYGEGHNGGGYNGGAGFLFDAEGNDYYWANYYGANGGGYGGNGFLLDSLGFDQYRAGAEGINGGGVSPWWSLTATSGFLADLDGNELYEAWAWGTGVNGGASFTGSLVPATGLLYDGFGWDYYSEAGTSPCNGTGQDRTVVPKCEVGAQIDAGPELLNLVDLESSNNPNGTCTYYNDSNHNNVPDDLVVVIVPCPALRAQSNPDGTTSYYDDRNDNNQMDAGEHVFTPPRVGTVDHNDGSCTYYDDANHDGFQSPGETSLRVACPDAKTATSGCSAILYDDKDGDNQVDAGEQLARSPQDDDCDLVPDELEPVLCSQQNSNFNFDGTCVGDDYTPVTPAGLFADVEKIINETRNAPDAIPQV